MAQVVCHAVLLEVISKIRRASHPTYGARRVHAELIYGRDLAAARYTVELIIRRKIPNQRTATDLVDCRLCRDKPDQLRVADITEHPPREPNLYCAVVLDVFSRRAMGWCIDSRLYGAVCTNALVMTIDNSEPRRSIVHSTTVPRPDLSGRHDSKR